MNLDPRTIVLISFISSFIMSIGLLTISSGYLSQIKTVKKWAYATLIHAFGWGLVGFRGYIPVLFSMVLGNIFLMISLAMYFNILARFKNIKIKSYWIYLPIFIFSIVISYYSLVFPHFGNRIIASSVCSFVLMFSSTYLLLFYNKNRTRADTFAALVFAACGAIMLIRSIIFINAPARIQDFLLAKSVTNDFLFITYYITSVIISFGFVLMCNERYLAERKLAESELKHSKEILEETNQIARIGNWEFDLINNKSYWSKVTREIYEVPNDFIPTIESIIIFLREGENRETFSTIIKDVQQKQTSFDLNLEIISALGNERTIRIIGESEFTENVCSRIFGIFQDITNEIQLKKEVKNVEQRFKDAFEYSAIGIALVGLDGKWEAVNQEVCNITGYSKSELHNITFKDITHPDDLEADLNYLQQLRDNKIKSYSMEKRYFHKNGNIIWIFLAVSAIRDKENNVVQYISQITDISDRKKIDIELQKSQQEYKSLFEQNPDAVYSLDKAGNFVTANDSMLKMAACNREVLLESHFSQFVIPEDLERVKQHFKEAQKGIPQNYTASFKNFNGVIRNLNVTNMPIIVDGKMIGNYGIAKDITEQIFNSENLKRSEQQLKEAQKIARLGNYSYDFKTKVWNCSVTIDEITGLNKKDITDLENWKKLLTPEYRNQFMEKLNETILFGKDIPKNNHDYKIIRPDGEERWISLNGEMEYDNEGIPVKLFGTAQDITYRKVTEKSLKLSEEKYRNLFNSNPIPICIWDLETYKIVEINEAATKVYGYSHDEFYDMSVLDLRVKEEQPNFIQVVNDLKSNQESELTKTWKHINKKGEPMDMNVSAFKIVYNDKPAILALAENVTEKIKVENRLLDSYKEIRMLTNHLQIIREEERSHIAREIHDELGQQLTVLKMDILSIKNKLEIQTPFVQTKTDKMIQMVDNSIQTIKKISSELRPGILDDLGLIAALEWHAKEFQQQTDIVCNFETTCTDDNFTKKINIAVFRIFQESLTNVARHSKASKVNSKLYIEDDMLYLHIDDNGIGISSENKKKKESFGLLGMKERATMLKGDILIQNLPVGGTRVTLKIPALC